MKTRNLVLKIFFVLLFIMLVNAVQTYVLHITKQFGDIDFYRISTHIFGILACIISLISTVLAWKILSKLNLKNLAKTGTAFLLSVLILAVLSSLYYVSERFIIYGLSTSFNMIIGNFVFTSVIYHLYISSLTLVYFYFQENAKTKFDLKIIEKEKEFLQFKILQKNLEPHFLFNNLSVLSGLIKKDPKEVENFIEDFSDVYRYYLKHSESDLVSLNDEVVFLEKYISLMKKRFNNSYLFDNQVDDKNGYILPCALQLCVENAIKHNRGSVEEPLQISVKRIGEFIEITNDFRPVDFTEGSGLGNQFLEKSYLLNFSKKISIVQTDSHYTVKIPIIQ